MGLNDEERRTLRALMAKDKEPDAPPIGKSISVHIDLGDAKQVAQAQKLGLLDSLEDPEPESGGEGDGEGEGDETPRRRSYFQD